MGTLSKKRQAEIARIIKDKSVRMRSSERVKIRKQATAALRTHAGHDTNWMIFFPQRRLWPFRSRERQAHVIREFEKNPETVSEFMAERMNGYDSLVSKITKVFEDENSYPFAIVKNLYPSCIFPWSFTRRTSNREESHLYDEWYLRDFVYEFVSSGLIKMTGKAVHRCKEPGEPPWREYMTSSNEEINVRSDGYDLPLRFRQATTDLKMTGESDDVKEPDVAARVVIFACVENPINDPIYLLPTSEVFNELTDEDIESLAKYSFSFFDRLKDNLKQHNVVPNQRIAFPKGSPNSNWLSFDLNRMDLETNAINEQRQALKNLVDAIERLDKGKKTRETEDNWAESRAIPVFLRRGDALVIDNYRMLFRRREQTYKQFNRLLWNRPAKRWLRVYYGFPDPQSDNGKKTNEGE